MPAAETPTALVRRARKTHRVLAETYPEARCELDFDDAFQLLVVTVLSAQTTDRRVNAVRPTLFAAYADARAPMSTTTRGMLSDVRPGYFGISFPVGRMVASKPQGRFALLRQSSIQKGYLYPGVTHDGMIAFWNPSAQVTTLTLLITDIKTKFHANDEPKKALEFPFTFTVRTDKK